MNLFLSALFFSFRFFFFIVFVGLQAKSDSNEEWSATLHSQSTHNESFFRILFLFKEKSIINEKKKIENNCVCLSFFSRLLQVIRVSLCELNSIWRHDVMMNYGLLLLVCASIGGGTYAADILMLTMGGTKSHKIPFQELAKGLIPR